MNTSLVGLAKIAAVVFSSTLAAVFVYDRATGGAFYRRLTDPSSNPGDATPVSSSQSVAPTDESAPGSEAPRILFSGSKSYSGGTEIVSGSLEPTQARPEDNVLVFGGTPDKRPTSDTVSSETAPPTILMSGSKSLLPTPVPVAGPPSSPPIGNPTPAAYSPPKRIFSSSKSDLIFYEPPATQTAPVSRPPANLPPYANSPAYANVPLTPQDAGGPPAPVAPPADPPRPSTIMMGTKSAPVFTPPLQPSDVVRHLGQPLPQGPRPPTQTAAPSPANPFGPGQPASPRGKSSNRNGQVQR